MMNYLWVALGGALGSMARYGFATWAQPISGTLPWGTILINILGSFVIGLFARLGSQSGYLPLSPEIRVFLMVGICGGFTTFSSFSLQTLALIRENDWPMATINVVLSCVACLAAVAFGNYLVSRFGVQPTAPF